MNGPRLIAVLGYSGRDGGAEPNHITAARLARAGEEALPGDTILFSGWRRPRRASSEAELMSRGWSGNAGDVLLDTVSRTTYGNVLATAAAARALAAREIVLVTSGWHARRASRLLEAAHGRKVLLAATDERGTIGARIRELGCWLLVPFQAAYARRRR